MKRRQGKLSIISLIIVSLITLLLIFLELNSKSKTKAEYYNEKTAAAELTRKAFETIRAAVDSLHIVIDNINDPNETGLIGIQYSPITTERGDLTAKLTATNPNFAAMIIELLKTAGLKKGDTAAVALSGSLPALNIAALCALQTLGVEPIIVTSAGSAMWGANYPEFTYLDMEALLHKKGIIKYRTRAATLGGKDDIGRGLSPEGREYLTTAIQRNDIEFLEADNLEHALTKRMEFYGRYKNIKLFINIDEYPTPLMGKDTPNGFIAPHRIKNGTGVIPQFSDKGIPVVNLVNINRLAEKYRLPIAPIPVPDIGEGRLYYEYRYSVNQAVVSLVILLIILFILLRYDIEYYIARRKND